jgi:hypothetical protein
MLNITNYQGNANQNHKERSPHHSLRNADEDLEKKKPLYIVGGNVN